MYSINTWMENWDKLYMMLGIKDFIYFISSPTIQDILFPVRLICLLFSAFFLCAIIWFYTNSSYLKFQFLQDTTEFFSWHAYGLQEVNRQWKKIIKKTESGSESEYKLAILEADDYLQNVLDEFGFEGESFEDIVGKAAQKMALSVADIEQAHAVRNAIVYNSDYRFDQEVAKKALADYESAIKQIAAS